MPNVTFHAAAETEYQEAYAWYHGRSELAADRFEQAMARTLDEIAAAPERGIPFGRKHRCRLVTTAFTCRAGCKERDVSKNRHAGPVKCNALLGGPGWL